MRSALAAFQLAHVFLLSMMHGRSSEPQQCTVQPTLHCWAPTSEQSSLWTDVRGGADLVPGLQGGVA